MAFTRAIWIIGVEVKIKFFVFTGPCNISEKNLSTGGGAVESAIRRVINYRIKGAAIYWTAVRINRKTLVSEQLTPTYP